MKDAVGRERLTENRPVYVPEYLVSFEHLAQIALEYQLELVEKKNFHAFYQENIALPHNQALFQRIVSHDTDNQMSKEQLEQQWEICGLYTVFAFRKQGPKGRRRRDNFGNRKQVRFANVKDWR